MCMTATEQNLPVSHTCGLQTLLSALVFWGCWNQPVFARKMRVHQGWSLQVCVSPARQVQGSSLAQKGWPIIFLGRWFQCLQEPSLLSVSGCESTSGDESQMLMGGSQAAPCPALPPSAPWLSWLCEGSRRNRQWVKKSWTGKIIPRNLERRRRPHAGCWAGNPIAVSMETDFVRHNGCTEV